MLTLFVSSEIHLHLLGLHPGRRHHRVHPLDVKVSLQVRIFHLPVFGLRLDYQPRQQESAEGLFQGRYALRCFTEDKA